MDDYGSLVVALVALLGVIVTISVNDWRVRRLARQEKEEKYRTEAREKIAEVLTLFADLLRHLYEMRMWRDIRTDESRLSAWRNEYFETEHDLRRRLLIAHLLCHEDPVWEVVKDLNHEMKKLSRKCSHALDEVVTAEIDQSISLFSENQSSSPELKHCILLAEHLTKATIYAYSPLIRERQVRKTITRRHMELQAAERRSMRSLEPVNSNDLNDSSLKA